MITCGYVQIKQSELSLKGKALNYVSVLKVVKRCMQRFHSISKNVAGDLLAVRYF